MSSSRERSQTTKPNGSIPRDGRLLSLIFALSRNPNRLPPRTHKKGAIGSSLKFFDFCARWNLEVISYLLTVNWARDGADYRTTRPRTTGGCGILNRILVNLTLDNASRSVASSGFARNSPEHFLKE